MSSLEEGWQSAAAALLQKNLPFSGETLVALFRDAAKDVSFFAQTAFFQRIHVCN